MTKVKVNVVDGYEHRRASTLARRSGTAAEKVQQLIDLYALHPLDSDVPVAEVIENLKLLKRVMRR